MTNRRIVDADRPPTFEPEDSTAAWRLRHWLVVLTTVALGCWLYPRGKAAWLLHDRATAVADYALCMAGPLGPSSLMEHPNEFKKLLRSRLLVAKPDAQPFASCAPLAEAASGTPDFGVSHGHNAVQYAEYGSRDQGIVRGSLAQLAVPMDGLGALAEAAWPFVRDGYVHLVKPSLNAKEALHPSGFPDPGLGQGLPGFRTAYRTAWQVGDRWLLAFGAAGSLSVLASSDEGVSWESVSLNQPGVGENAGRCRSSIAPAQVSFTVDKQEDGLYLESYLGSEKRSTIQLVGVQNVLSMSCDQTSTVFSVESATGQRSILGCRFGEGCYTVPADPTWTAAHFDIAQVAGTTILATVESGIVRVRSSRDQGRSWTPATVAFDWQAHPSTTDIKLPNRLLSLGKRVLLYGAANAGQTYPILVSDDFGASFHAPAQEAPLVGQASR